MKTTLYLVRHGETDWNVDGRLQGRENIPLNENGTKQAYLLAEFFKNQPCDKIISSPLKRAFETAHIIASSIGITDVHVINELVERDWGSASGLLPDERHKIFPAGIPDQEDFETLQARGMKCLNEIVKKFENKNIIIVSHGGIINSMLHAISQGEFGSFKTRLKNASINKIIYNDYNWYIEYYNKTVSDFSSYA